MCVILSLALGYTPGSAWKRTQLLLFRWLVVSKKAEARYYCLRQELASWTLREELQPCIMRAPQLTRCSRVVQVYQDISLLREGRRSGRGCLQTLFERERSAARQAGFARRFNAAPLHSYG